MAQETLYLPPEVFKQMRENSKGLVEDITKATLDELKIIAELVGDQYKHDKEAEDAEEKRADEEKAVFSKLEKMAEAYVLQNKPALAKMNIMAIKYWNKFVVKNKFFEKTLELLKKGLAQAGSFLWDLLKGILFLSIFDPNGALAGQLIEMITNLVIWFIDLLIAFIPRFLDALFIALPRIAKALYDAFWKISAKIGELIFKIFAGVLKGFGIDIGPVSENIKKGVGALALGLLILSKMGLLTPVLKLLQSALWAMVAPLITAITPFLPVILAVAAAIAALVAVFIYAEQIVAWFEGLWKSFWEWFDTLGSVGKTIIGALVAVLALVFFPITLLIGALYLLAKAFAWIKDLFTKFDKWTKTSKIGKWIGKIVSFLSKLPKYFDWLLHADWSDITALISNMFTAARLYAAEVFMGFFDWALNGLMDMWNNMVGWVKRKLKDIGKAIGELFSANSLGTFITTLLTNIFGTEFTTRLFEGIKNAFSLVTDFLLAFVMMVQGMVTFGGNVYTGMKFADLLTAAKISRTTSIEATSAAAIVKAAEAQKGTVTEKQEAAQTLIEYSSQADMSKVANELARTNEAGSSAIVRAIESLKNTRGLPASAAQKH